MLYHERPSLAMYLFSGGIKLATTPPNAIVDSVAAVVPLSRQLLHVSCHNKMEGNSITNSADQDLRLPQLFFSLPCDQISTNNEGLFCHEPQRKGAVAQTLCCR